MINKKISSPPNNLTSRELGAWGEKQALDFLVEIGYVLLKKNYHHSHSEIDIIVQKDNDIVFVEVKTASSLKLGTPESWVTPSKQRQIGGVAEKFVFENENENAEYRFDVIGISIKSNFAELTHIKNAFWLSDD